MCFAKMINKTPFWIIPLFILICAFGAESAEMDSISPDNQLSLELPTPFDEIMTTSELWVETFTLVNEKYRDIIASELAVARITTPKLALSYELLIGYTQFLQRVHYEFPHFIEPPDFCPPIVPPVRCITPLPGMEDYCLCFYENDFHACGRWIASQKQDEDLPEIWSLIPSCDDLLANYKKAIQAISEILERGTPTPEDMEDVKILQAEADKYWEEYIKRGCDESDTVEN